MKKSNEYWGRKGIITLSNQNNEAIVSNKGRHGLYFKTLVLLKDAENEIPPLSRKSFLPYKKVYQKLCRAFSMPDYEILEVLYLLEEMELISFVKFKGIKLDYKIVP